MPPETESTLYRKHRPKSLEDVVGQPEAIATLGKYLARNELPQTILLSGPTGTGKTSLALILKDLLGCKGRDFTKINAAESRGIDTVREVKDQMDFGPAFSKAKVWVFDEVHRLTADSQSALLDMTEFIPPKIYFIFTTTEPDRILKTLRDRFAPISLKAISQEDLTSLLETVWGEETGVTPNADVIHDVAEAARGSARSALNILEQVLCFTTPEEQLAAVSNHAAKRQAEFLGRLLMKDCTWTEVVKAITDAPDADPESIRYAVLGYMSAIMLGKGREPPPRARWIISKFECHFRDSGKAGLVSACYDVVFGGRKSK